MLVHRNAAAGDPPADHLRRRPPRRTNRILLMPNRPAVRRHQVYLHIPAAGPVQTFWAVGVLVLLSEEIGTQGAGQGSEDGH